MKKPTCTWGITLLVGCAIVSLVHAAEPETSQGSPDSMAATADEIAIRKIIKDEIAAWNRGDAAAYSRQFAADGTFTNIRGQFFVGHEAFLKRHEVIFQGIFRNTTLQQDIVSLKFIGSDVAVVDMLTSVAGMAETPPGTVPDSKGRLRTRLLQVVAKRGADWWIVAYHNVDVKPGVPVAEPN
ncbi:MAG TPA: SgcJ/EcaC family oxidoreductase [Steroidobacteraceae bacterium]|nr:SgcJ/EcaC family oxidoreductase [Steroidobacteraceae bacterium]